LRHRDESWHHGDPATRRETYFPRPAGDRALVRRKTFALRPESLEDALFDLEALDHDFYLFVHEDSGDESVVYRRDEGFGVIQRTATPDAVGRVGIPLEVGVLPPTLDLDGALALLEASDAPFVFFVEASRGRGCVVYRRYDGHYGLITPADM
jgi:hypothetical protein